MGTPAQTNFYAGSLGGALSTRTVKSVKDKKPEVKQPEQESATDAPVSTAENVDRKSAYVVEGTAAEVLAWVGDDPDRAADALRVEEASERPRKTLVSSLQSIVKAEED